MSKNVVLREYQKSDRKYLENIIRRTWHYDRFCSSKTAARLARIYLTGCMGNQTFIRVAEVEGVASGVIMGKDCRGFKVTAASRLKLLGEGLLLCSGREGRRIAGAYSGIDQVDQALLKDSGRQFQGEVAFFAIDEKCRGLGIGKMLFGELLSYMKGRGIHMFYLFTDSSCNYGFYEHQGMRRCGKTCYEVPLGIKNEMEFYLYEYTGNISIESTQ